MLVLPSPNFQDQLVGVPVEVSVKFHFKGAPLVGLALKLATGGAAAAETWMVWVFVLLPAEFVAVRLTV